MSASVHVCARVCAFVCVRALCVTSATTGRRGRFVAAATLHHWPGACFEARKCTVGRWFPST